MDASVIGSQVDGKILSAFIRATKPAAAPVQADKRCCGACC
jgi:hypothetical protein